MQGIGGIPEAGLCSEPDRTITNENVSYAFVQPLDEMARPHIGQLQNIFVLLYGRLLMLQNNALKSICLVFIVFWDISIYRRHEGSRIKGTKNLSVFFAVRPDARGTRHPDRWASYDAVSRAVSAMTLTLEPNTVILSKLTSFS